MIILNSDQLAGKHFVKDWWASSKQCMLIEGRAGVGKTAMVLETLSSLYKCDPVITAPTNEAVRQLSIVVGKAYPLRTTYSALGFSFDTTKEIPVLVNHGLPPEVDHYNLIVVDEASMVGNVTFKPLIDSGKRILFLGHSSQLPEVVTKLSNADRCESLVFKQKYPTYHLTKPIRNTGELFAYCNHLESLIYAKPPRIIKGGYGITLEGLNDYIYDYAKVEIFSGYSTIIGWSNKMVDAVNKTIRQTIFNEEKVERFYVGDKLILTAPNLYVGKIDNGKEKQLLKLRHKAIQLSSNSKTSIVKIRHCKVLEVSCWALECKLDKQTIELFVVKDLEEFSLLQTKFLHHAYSCKGMAKHRAFEDLHYIIRLFSQVKHSYCITVHRSQGMSVDKSVVLYNNIRQCSNVYLKHKLLYVAASRAKKELMIVR